MTEDSFEKARKAFFAPAEKAPEPSAPADEMATSLNANTTIVSGEDFSSEISNSAQKDRIITLAKFFS
ncbi:MAG: hypothetical protein WCA38_12225 [Candidatus Acidiferrales bacterium]